jgi:hypothetical protein
MSRTILITTTVAVAGSVLLFGAAGNAVADVPVGTGPTNYTYQPQPAPGTCHYRTAANGETLPDPNCTPGAISPKVTEDTLATTICKTGYSTGPGCGITTGPGCGITITAYTATSATATTAPAPSRTLRRRHHGRGRGCWAGGC